MRERHEAARLRAGPGLYANLVEAIYQANVECERAIDRVILGRFRPKRCRAVRQSVYMAAMARYGSVSQ